MEEAVVGQVHDGRPVGLRRETQRQFRWTSEAIGQMHVKPSGVALLAIRAAAGERHLRLGAVLHIGDLPELAVKAVEAAMQSVRSVVGGELYLRAIEHKARIGNPV